jgi:4-alpha-glucanotransferase
MMAGQVLSSTVVVFSSHKSCFWQVVRVARCTAHLCSATAEDKRTIKQYLGSDGQDIAWDFIKACMHSAARTCIMMMQDVMRLDNSARMNTPGVAAGNWKWRIGDEGVWGQLSREAGDLRELARVTARLYVKPQPPQDTA